MTKSTAYFVKFSLRHCPKFLFFSCIVQICSSLNVIFNLIFARRILDALFVWHQLNQAVYYVILFGSINLVLQVLRNIFYLFSTNEKNELQKEFELFLYKKLGLCDYERIELPHFLEQKEKAGYYIGGQWGEFGKQLDIVFELFGNIIVLSGMFLLLLKLKFVFVFGNLRALYYSEHYMKSDWMHLFLIT